MTVRALALESGVTGLEDHRLLVGALLGGVDSGWALDRRPGLLGGAGNPAALSGSGMVATVAPFAAVVPGGSSPTQGPYLIVSTDAEEITLPDGPSTGTRTDTLGVVVHDDPYDATGEAAVDIRVIDPETDTTALPLHDVAVPVGASAGTGGIPWASAAIDRRTYTSTHGGVIPVPDMAARNRLGAVRPGTLVHVASVDGLFMRVPTGWVAAAGQALYDALAGVFQPLGGTIRTGRILMEFPEERNGSSQILAMDYYVGTARITLPPGLYSAAPLVFLTPRSGVPGTMLEANYTNVSATGFDIVAARGTRTSTWIDWMTVGAT